MDFDTIKQRSGAYRASGRDKRYMITATEAKALATEILKYFAEHPEVDNKAGLPDHLWNKLRGKRCLCPLCEYFFNTIGVGCSSCPLGDCIGECSIHSQWCFSKTDKERKTAALKGLVRIQAWGIDKQ